MRDMNLDGNEVPSPAVTDDDESEESSDSDDSEAENEALKSGDYGMYRWGKGALKKKARGSLAPSSGGFPVSGKRAAKKAAKKAFKRGDSPEDFGLRRPRAVAETLAGMIRSGGAYIGFQSGMSDDALRGLLGIAHAMGLKAELRGGGKRRHAVVHWAHGARVPRDGDERLERAIASAEGEPHGHVRGGEGVDAARRVHGARHDGQCPGVQREREGLSLGALDEAGVNGEETGGYVDGDGVGIVFVGLVAAKVEGYTVFEPRPGLLVPLAAHQPRRYDVVVGSIGGVVHGLFDFLLGDDGGAFRFNCRFLWSIAVRRHQRIVLALEHERHIARTRRPILPAARVEVSALAQICRIENRNFPRLAEG